MGRVLTITSGKGGVGKTNLSLNLGLCLSRMGHKTCIFDADLGLANINILLGLRPEHDLKEVLTSGRSLQEIIIRTEEGLDILPGTSGVEEIANLDSEGVNALIHSFSGMDPYEFLIFDTSAGISKNVISFCLASSEVILVVTPEPTSMTDAFALLKVLYSNGFGGEARVVLNQCKTAEAGRQAYARFKAAVSKYLEKDLVALGMIMEDEKLTEAVRLQRPLQSAFPGSAAARCIQKIAERLTANGDLPPQPMDMEGFWRRCLQAVHGPLKLPGKVKEKQPGTVPPPPLQEMGRAEPQGPMVPGPPVAQAVPADTGPRPSASNTRPDFVPPPRVGAQAGEMTSFLPVMERLIETIGSVSKEVQLMREMMGGNGRPFFDQNNGLQRLPANSSPKPIRLDLNAFLRRLQGERKE